MSWWFNDSWQVWICDTCNGWEFEEWDSLVEHLECNHNNCMHCRRGFVSGPALRSHWANNSSHAFCVLCNTHFAGQSTLYDHKMNDHFPCEGCYQIFATELGRYEHGRQAHPFCTLSEANLRANRSASPAQHNAAGPHVQAQNICPAGCRRRFVDRSATVLHLEAGTCSSGMTRQRIDYFVRSLDTSRLITTSAPLLITGSNEPAYECFFCHKLFQSLLALNQHLTSPRHAYATETGRDGEKIYKCPNTFRMVQNTLDGFMGQMRTLTY
ncbi:hypothetical protein JCM10295v2_000866 [Rhodotorula toruloides]